MSRWTEQGDHTSITEAVNALHDSEDIHLYTKNGRYREKIRIEKKNIFLEGESKEGTILGFRDGAFHVHPDGKPFGTFRSYTFYCRGEKVRLHHLTLKNIAKEGDINGQGIALYLDALHFDVSDVALIGHLDTLFMAPLPKEPRTKGSFLGPGEYLERRSSTEKSRVQPSSVMWILSSVAQMSFLRTATLNPLTMGKEN